MDDPTTHYINNKTDSTAQLDEEVKNDMLDRITEYTCLNKYFTTKEIISKEDAYGISEKDGEFFGQVKNNKKNGIGKN